MMSVKSRWIYSLAPHVLLLPRIRSYFRVIGFIWRDIKKAARPIIFRYKFDFLNSRNLVIRTIGDSSDISTKDVPNAVGDMLFASGGCLFLLFNKRLIRILESFGQIISICVIRDRIFFTHLVYCHGIRRYTSETYWRSELYSFLVEDILSGDGKIAPKIRREFSTTDEVYLDMDFDGDHLYLIDITGILSRYKVTNACSIEESTRHDVMVCRCIYNKPLYKYYKRFFNSISICGQSIVLHSHERGHATGMPSRVHSISKDLDVNTLRSYELPYQGGMYASMAACDFFALDGKGGTLLRNWKRLYSSDVNFLSLSIAGEIICVAGKVSNSSENELQKREIGRAEFLDLNGEKMGQLTLPNGINSVCSLHPPEKRIAAYTRGEGDNLSSEALDQILQGPFDRQPDGE